MTASPISRRQMLVGSLAMAAMPEGRGAAAQSAQALLNVSYDPTRELYRDFNAAFAAHWAARGNPRPTITTSHGGSGRQARSVLDGLPADVVTLALGQARSSAALMTR